LKGSRFVRKAGRGVAWAVALSLTVISPSAAQSTQAPLSDARPILETFGKRALDQSLPEAERVQTISLLGLWATEEVREPLMALLSDPKPAIRLNAAHALGWKGNTAAATALEARVVAPGEGAEVRVAAIRSLGRIGNESSRPTVLTAIRDPDVTVRSAALQALTLDELKSPSDRIPLLRQMAADREIDPLLRSQALQNLGGAKDTGSTELFLRLAEQEPSSPMPRPSAAPTERETLAVRYRQARDVKAWAVMGLFLVEAKQAIPLLVSTADDPRDYFLRLISLRALGTWKAKEGLPVFVKRLEDPLDLARIAALQGVAAVGDRAQVGPVVARLSDGVPEVRAQAVDTLAVLGGPEARTALEALRDKEADPRVNDALARAFRTLAP
jgi:HEAT repeat protein